MLNIPINIHNNYRIYKYIDGKRVELAKFNNIVLNNMYDRMLSSGSSNFINSAVFGTGTAEPAATDTKLTNKLWNTSYSDNSQTVSIKVIEIKAPVPEKNKLTYNFTLIVPASPHYVGTVTEMGLMLGSDLLLTKALIKDAEGNPISITKTEVEALYVDVQMQIQLAESDIFEWNDYFLYAMMQEGPKTDKGNYIVSLPSFGNSLITFLHGTPYKTGGVQYNYVQGNRTWDKNNHAVSFSNNRMGTNEITDETYINYIGLKVGLNFTRTAGYQSDIPAVQLGWLEFPNSKLFTPTTLSNMSIGVGDGSTTDFEAPIGLWIKDTEKIYIDGVLQNRGVDYTCDHRNNHKSLKHLYPSSKARVLNTLYRYAAEKTTYGYNYTKPISDKCCNILNGCMNDQGNSRSLNYMLWTDKEPFSWELSDDTTIGYDADYFVLNPIKALYSYISNGVVQQNIMNLKNFVFTLKYSEDNTSWHIAGSYTVPTSVYQTEAYTMTFSQRISAKYWKLEVDYSNKTDTHDVITLTLQDRNKYCYLGRNGEPIKFTNPPAAGAIITMDADIDRPMKNSNFIIECNQTIQLS